MLKGSLLALAVLMAASLTASAQVGAPLKMQKDELSVDEQPGYEPSPDEEALPLAYQRQLVFFRSTEPPGTVVIYTSQ